MNPTDVFELGLMTPEEAEALAAGFYAAEHEPEPTADVAEDDLPEPTVTWLADDTVRYEVKSDEPLCMYAQYLLEATALEDLARHELGGRWWCLRWANGHSNGHYRVSVTMTDIQRGGL